MKLLMCVQCGDVFNVNMNYKSCSCGDVGGKYLNNINAVFHGVHSVPIGFSNHSIRTAIKINKLNMASVKRLKHLSYKKNVKHS